MEDPKEIVRRGYDALSYRYRGDAEEPELYATWLAQLQGRVPAGGAVSDLGCGCGVPLARNLAASGYVVTGVDLSVVQIQRARRLVPTAQFLHADATQMSFPPSSFDAVVSLYALIHMPLEEQPSLLGRIGRWLRPRGWLLAPLAGTARLTRGRASRSWWGRGRWSSSLASRWLRGCGPTESGIMRPWQMVGA